MSWPITVLIRPRGGDFLYTDDEFAIMKDDIALCKQEGVTGFAIGMLLPDSRVDCTRIQELIDLCLPNSTLTFHRGMQPAKHSPT